MTRQQKVLNNFKKNFEKFIGERILIYGRGMYTKLIIENFREFSFIGILDRLDLEGSYCGVPILKYDEVVNSNAKIIIIAASLINTETIRRRIGNFCISNGISLYSLDGELLNIRDCIVSVKSHGSHKISQKNLRESIDRHTVICFDLQSLLIENYGEKGSFYTIRKALIDDLEWAIAQRKRVVLYIESVNSREYQFFYGEHMELCNKLILFEEKKGDSLSNLNKPKNYSSYKGTFLFIGREKCEVAKTAGSSIFRIYTPFEMLQNSSYNNLLNSGLNELENIYLQVIINYVFSSPYALAFTGGKVQIKSAYDIGYIFFGPIVLDFMFWFIKRLRQDAIKKIIFSARDGYVFQKIYNYIINFFDLTDLPESLYFYTSRRVCNMVRINCESDIKHLAKEYFHGNISEMLVNRFMLSEIDLCQEPDFKGIPDLEYVKYFTFDILNKAIDIKKQYLKYIESLRLDFNEKMVFFDLFASGTCQLALSKLCNKSFKGLYFSRFPTDDPEKIQLDIESYLESTPFMEDHSLLLESILTSLEPTLSVIVDNGKLILGRETRSEEELIYIQETQEGILFFVEDTVKRLKGIPEIGRNFACNMFSMIISKYTDIDNYIFKNIILKDEILNRNQYLGDFYKY